MATINPYLGFGGQCREAMEFYKAAIGGELTFNLAGDTPGMECPEGMKEQVMHSQLISGEIVLMGTDMTMQQEFVVGNNFSIAVGCDSEEQLNDWFTKLSEGGTVTHPPKEEFWGAVFASFIDKYHISWMFNYYKTPAM